MRCYHIRLTVTRENTVKTQELRKDDWLSHKQFIQGKVVYNVWIFLFFHLSTRCSKKARLLKKHKS